MKDKRELESNEVLVDLLHMSIDEQKDYIVRMLHVPVLEGKRVVLQHDPSIDAKALHREAFGRLAV